MGTEHTFYDYVDNIDDTRTNAIHTWLNSIPKGAKQKLNNRLLHLEATPQGQWTRPLVDTLTVRGCDGLFEVRARLGTQQYRILGYHGPGMRTPTLLWGFIKSGAAVPQIECQRAQDIKARVGAKPNHRREEHNYG